MADEQTPEETPIETPVVEPTDAPTAEEPSVTGAPAEEPAAGAPDAPASVEAPATESAAAADVPSVPKGAKKRLPRGERHKHSKPRRDKPATRKPIVRGEQAVRDPGRRQERRGVVVSDKGDKTIVVKVETIRAHPKYKKVVRRSRKFHAHDEQNTAGIGDTVRIVETRPLSKLKNWRLAEIVEKAR